VPGAAGDLRHAVGPRLAAARPAAWLTLGLLVAMLAACQPASLGGAVRDPAPRVADISLPDASRGGALTPMKAPPGELLLVYFGYTSCPDICPTTMSDISVALADLPADAARRVAVAMVTVDPERDTAETLSGYLSYFFERSHALRTDDPEMLAEAARAFGAQWEVAPHGPGDSAYEVAHTAITYVVDDTGTVAVEWPFGFATDAMSSDLAILLERYQT
jgi:protein SCO1/2